MMGKVCRALIVTLTFTALIITSPCYGGVKAQERAPLQTITIAQNPYAPVPYDRYQEWERLSPQEREQLRQRWRYYQNLPPQERQLLKRRYEEWRKLPPEDQRVIKEKLRRWEELSPEEQEAIRQRFRR
jgi:hypothetical protein